MKDPTSVIWRCTAQLRDGRFCDARGIIDAPFPICNRHADQLARFMEIEPNDTAVMKLAVREFMGDSEQYRAEYEASMKLREQRMKDQSVVYYVRIHDHIKIGYTINVRQRLGALRVNGEMLLATEPGGRELEAERHRQFADERVGRREDFNPSRRLLAHISAILSEHGPPLITSYRSGQPVEDPAWLPQPLEAPPQ